MKEIKDHRILNELMNGTLMMSNFHTKKMLFPLYFVYFLQGNDIDIGIDIGN